MGVHRVAVQAAAPSGGQLQLQPGQPAGHRQARLGVGGARPGQPQRSAADRAATERQPEREPTAPRPSPTGWRQVLQVLRFPQAEEGRGERQADSGA